MSEEKDKLPDENLDDLDNFEIEIEDDTPEEDRGREPMPEDIVQDLEKDDLKDYDAKVQERLRQAKKVYHDERRRAEAAQREREAAVDAARKLYDENRRLKETLTQGEKEYVETVQLAAKLALDAAKKDLREAQESGDTDKIISAQEMFTEASIRADRAKSFKPTLESSLQAQEDSVERTQQPVSRPSLDSNTQNWMGKNAWFNKDVVMTESALDVHNQLEARYGPEFVGSEDYFRVIDNKMREKYPDYFKASKSGTQTSNRGTPATVVAPATRSTAPKQVRLTQSQVALAKKFGLTPEQYAKEVIKMEKANVQ